MNYIKKIKKKKKLLNKIKIIIIKFKKRKNERYIKKFKK